MPEGIPAVALGGLFEDSKMEITVVSGPSVLSSELIKKDYDVIVAPIILGAQLYTKGSLNYKLKLYIIFDWVLLNLIQIFYKFHFLFGISMKSKKY